MSSDDSLVKTCRELGYHTEYPLNFDGTEDKKMMIVEFPCQSGKDAILAKDMSAIQQLDLVKRLQTIWSDNAVSCTVYYRKEELDSIKSWLKDNYKTAIKSVSFLLHSDHGFQQPPYEEIDEEIYKKRTAQLKPLKMHDGGEAISFGECESGACPVR